MRKHIVLVGLACAAALGCGTSGNQTPIITGTSTATSGGDLGLVVTATRFRFFPSDLQATEGQTVTWNNTDTIDHTVTSGANGVPDGKFDQLLHPGDSFQFTFTQAGAYPYFCRFHISMGMVGTVTVQTVTASGSTGTSGTTTTSTATTGATGTTGTTGTTTTTGVAATVTVPTTGTTATTTVPTTGVGNGTVH
jgi:plastocyanin